MQASVKDYFSMWHFVSSSLSSVRSLLMFPLNAVYLCSFFELIRIIFVMSPPQKRYPTMYFSFSFNFLPPWPISQDDIIDDLEDFVAAAEILKERGAYKIYIMATHGLLSGDAPRLIEESAIDEVK